MLDSQIKKHHTFKNHRKLSNCITRWQTSLDLFFFSKMPPYFREKLSFGIRVRDVLYTRLCASGFFLQDVIWLSPSACYQSPSPLDQPMLYLYKWSLIKCWLHNEPVVGCVSGFVLRHLLQSLCLNVRWQQHLEHSSTILSINSYYIFSFL